MTYEKFLCSRPDVYIHFVNRYRTISGSRGKTHSKPFRHRNTMKKLSVLSVALKDRLHRRSTESTQPGAESGSENEAVLGRELGFMTRLVGCSHGELGRPFKEGKTQYRSCVKCGARRQFNSETFETFGKFYVPPVTTKNL